MTTRTPSDNNTANNATATAGSITIKVRRGQDLRRFEMSLEESSTLVSNIRSLWADLDDATRLTYLDDEGDNVTLASQVDVEEALQTLKLTGQHTLRLAVSDPNEIEFPDFDSCAAVFGKGKGKGKGGKGGKGKGCKGGKGKGGKGHRVAEALGLSVEEARELLHKAHDGDEAARKTLKEVRATHVAKELNITANKAMTLIEEAHNGNKEARQQLKALRHKMHPDFHGHHHHHQGPHHGPHGHHHGPHRHGKGHHKAHFQEFGGPHGHPYGKGGKRHGKCGGKGKFLAAMSGLPEEEVRELVQQARSGDEDARSKLQQIRMQFKKPGMWRMHRMNSALSAAFGCRKTDSSSEGSGSSSDSSSSDSD